MTAQSLITAVYKQGASFITVLLITLFVSISLSANDEPLANPAKEAVARELMKEIRCLVCQNQSIEDSNADLAKDLRRIVREQINNGKSPEETKSFLVARYGDWVLLKPPVNSGTIFLWGSPIILLIIGIWIIMQRSQSAKTAPEYLTKEEEAELKAIIDTENDTVHNLNTDKGAE